VPPEVAEAGVQVEGLEPTAAERLAMELERLHGVVDTMGATHQHVHAKVVEATGIMDENLSDQERQVLMRSRLADANARAAAAAAAAEKSEQVAQGLREEVLRSREALEAQREALQEARARLTERERVINELQSRLVSELQEVREVQVTTARDTMATMTQHHTQQAIVMKDVREAAVGSAAAAADHGQRIDALAVAQEKHAAAAQRTVAALEREAGELRSAATRLEQDNRNMTHKVTAQAALLGHVRRADREMADRLGTKVAGALGRILPDKLNVKGGGIHQGTDVPPANLGGPPGLWAYDNASNASTVTEDAESRSVVAPQWWLTEEAAAMKPPRGASGTAAQRDTRRHGLATWRSAAYTYPSEDGDEVELSDVESWGSLEELQAPGVAPGARVHPPPRAAPKATADMREGGSSKVVQWLGRASTVATETAEKTEGLLADSRALRTELNCLLNAEGLVHE